jgi:hypothetical protein
MCTPWDTTCMAVELATAVSNSIFDLVAAVFIAASQWLISVSASWWVMVPSISLYPNRGNTDPYASPISSVANLRALLLPITVVIAVGGMFWNGLLMVLSRKPAPLVNVLRGLWNTALWSAVGVFGTNLLLAGSDAFANHVISLALKSVNEPSLGKRLGSMLIPAAGPNGFGMPVGIVILISGIAMICAFVQALLMFFRDGSVLVLSATTSLAASGSFTNATQGWLPKLIAWQLSLIFYKDFAAIVYAVMIWMTGENNSSDPRVLLFGLAMMVTSLVALPVLLKFFNWTVGSLQNGGGGLGMLASAGAAGMHAASSLRGVGGGTSVNEHARYINETFGRGPGSGPGSRPTAGPTPTPGPGPGPGGAPASGPGADVKPPVFQGQAGPGKVANITSASGGATATGGATGAATASGATGAAAAGGANGAAMGAGMAASAAAGPAAPIVAGGVVLAGAAASATRSAATAAAGAVSESTKNG